MVPRIRWKFPHLGLSALGLSLLAHLLALGLVGGWVISRRVPPPAPFVAVPDPSTPSVLMEESAPAETETAVPEPSAVPLEPGPASGLAPGEHDPLRAPGLDLLTRSGASFPAFLLPGRGGAGPVGPGTGWSGKGTGAARPKTGNLFGMSVRAQRLGVLLDISGSMQPVLPEVVTTINRQFGDFHLILVWGCGVAPLDSDAAFERLPKTNPEPWQRFQLSSALVDQFRALPAPVYASTTADAGQGLRFAADQLGIDTLYWFADFQDPVAADQIRAVAEMLGTAGIRLYAHSVEDKPPPAVQSAILRTGGSYQVQRLK